MHQCHVWSLWLVYSVFSGPAPAWYAGLDVMFAYPLGHNCVLLVEFTTGSYMQKKSFDHASILYSICAPVLQGFDIPGGPYTVLDVSEDQRFWWSGVSINENILRVAVFILTRHISEVHQDNLNIMQGMMFRFALLLKCVSSWHACFGISKSLVRTCIYCFRSLFSLFPKPTIWPGALALSMAIVSSPSDDNDYLCWWFTCSFVPVDEIYSLICIYPLEYPFDTVDKFLLASRIQKLECWWLCC